MIFELLVLVASGLSVPEPEPLPVIGGDTAAACQWPTTVLMSGCSGTLVHPEVILYAAHCPGASSVRFGTTGGERTVGVDYCAAAPEYPQLGFDYAYCKLSQPVTDVPIVPVMMGCETDELPIGKRATFVGYGNTSNGGGGFGTKRIIDGDIAGFPDEGRKIGVFYDDPNTGICNGDSGGSAYTRLEDGSWRMFGIASTVPGSCGGSSQHIPAWVAVPWLEEHSGIDITPCHDSDGTWNPTADCGDFPLAPGDGIGLSWSSGCGPGMQSAPAQTCGPAFGEPPDLTAPTVSFVSPAPGAYDGPTLETSIELMVDDDWAVRDLTVAFAGEDQAYFEGAPFLVESVEFPEGTWEIIATATDWSGNETQQTVTIEVGNANATGGDSGDDDSSDAGSSSDGSDDSGGGGDSGGSEGGTTGDDGGGDTDAETTAAGDNGDGGGCRVSGTAPAPGALVLLGLLGLLRRRPLLAR